MVDPGDPNPTGPDPTGPNPTNKAVEGLVHVQAAAMEMIKAARSFLDVAEGLVQDPNTARTVMSMVATLAQAGRAAAGAPGGDEEPPNERVQRIPVE